MIKLVGASILTTFVALLAFLQQQTAISYEVMVGVASFSANVVGGACIWMVKSMYSDLKRKSEATVIKVDQIANEVSYMKGKIDGSSQ